MELGLEGKGESASGAGRLRKLAFPVDSGKGIPQTRTAKPQGTPTRLANGFGFQPKKRGLTPAWLPVSQSEQEFKRDASVRLTCGPWVPLIGLLVQPEPWI